MPSANSILQFTAAGKSPSYSNATYPATTTINRLLYSSSANTVSELITAIDGVLITDHAAGAPSVLANGTAGYVLTAQSGAPPAWAPGAAGYTTTQHAVLIGGAANAIASTGVGATGTVLIGNTGADPTYSGTPSLTGVNFGGTTLGTYLQSTFTPTLVGGSVAGTTTYTNQTGNYTRVGNVVTVNCRISISGATGTGDAVIGGIPLTPPVSSIGSVYFDGSGWAWPAGRTSLSFYLSSGGNGLLVVSGSAVSLQNIQMANAALDLFFSISYGV